MDTFSTSMARSSSPDALPAHGHDTDRPVLEMVIPKGYGVWYVGGSDHETREQRDRRLTQEWLEADLVEEAMGPRGGDGPFVVDTSDLMNGDRDRDLGRKHRA